MVVKFFPLLVSLYVSFHVLLWRNITQHLGSSALCVLSLQPVFVENDGGKCFLPQHIICEVLLLTYASVHIRWF